MSRMAHLLPDPGYADNPTGKARSLRGRVSPSDGSAHHFDIRLTFLHSGDECANWLRNETTS
jgi:hypothetical protein